MRYLIENPDGSLNFEITGTSLVTRPKNGTVMFITNKMQNALENLLETERCLIFAEEGMEIPPEVRERNCLRISEDAQAAYAAFILERQREDAASRADRKYTLTPEGWWRGENVRLGSGARIDPGCLIDHDVVIGENARIGYGSRISHAVIGDFFRCAEYTVVGTDAYYPLEDETHSFQLPSFGQVIIGDHVDLGGYALVERGVMGDTFLRDSVMVDSYACIGHEDDIGPNARICCGVKVAGLVNVGEKAYVGMNAAVKQRLTIGENAMVGIGSVVISPVKAGEKVFGNPARKMIL